MVKEIKLSLIILISFSSICSHITDNPDSEAYTEIQYELPSFDFNEMFSGVINLSSDLASSLTSVTNEILENKIPTDSINYDVSGITNLTSDVISTISNEVGDISISIGEVFSKLSDKYELDSTPGFTHALDISLNKGFFNPTVEFDFKMPTWDAVYDGGSKALDMGAYLYQALMESTIDGVDKVLLASEEYKSIFNTIVGLLTSLNNITQDELSTRLAHIMGLVGSYIGNIEDRTTYFDLSKFFRVNSIEFLEGFLEGISRVPFGQNQCYMNLFAIKDSATILNDLRHEGDLSLETLYKFYEKGGELLSNYKSCHFDSVVKEVNSLSMIYGYGIMAYRIVSNLKSVYSLFTNIKNIGETRDLGLYSGKLVKIVFNYSTE
jgi:hypothetical protein